MAEKKETQSHDDGSPASKLYTILYLLNRDTQSGGSTLVWQSLYCIASPDDVHQWDTRNLAYTSTEFSVTGSNDEAFVGSNALNKAVVGISARMTTGQTFETWITSDSKWEK